MKLIKLARAGRGQRRGGVEPAMARTRPRRSDTGEPRARARVGRGGADEGGARRRWPLGTTCGRQRWSSSAAAQTSVGRGGGGVRRRGRGWGASE
jgi:hypothetical protein